MGNIGRWAPVVDAILIFALLLSPFNIYNDVPADAWYKTAAEYVTAAGIMEGTGGGNFSPNMTVTRAQAAVAMIAEAGEGGGRWYNDNFLLDVRRGDWFYDAAQWAVHTATINIDGYRFMPGKELTRAEAMYSICRAATAERVYVDLSVYEDGRNIEPEHKDAVMWCMAHGVVSGKTKNGKQYIAPNDTITRAEFAQMIYKFRQIKDTLPGNIPEAEEAKEYE